MNRWLRLIIFTEVAFIAAALAFDSFEISGHWGMMLRLEKEVLLPRHIGISQSTWNACIVAMKILPYAACGAAFMLSWLLLRRLFRRWRLSSPERRFSEGSAVRRAASIADAGAVCVAGLLFAYVVIPDVAIPLWIPALAAAWITWYPLSHARRHQREGHCRECDYDLTGNVSGVCPECGTAVAGADSQLQAKPSGR